MRPTRALPKRRFTTHLLEHPAPRRIPADRRRRQRRYRPGAQASHRRAHRLCRARPRAHRHGAAIFSLRGRRSIPTEVHLHYADGRAYLKSAREHIRRDYRECARPADRAVEQVLYRRVLSLRARTSCAGRIAGPAAALVGGIHQPRPGGVPALHQPHTARSISIRRRNSRRDDPLLRRNAIRRSHG